MPQLPAELEQLGAVEILLGRLGPPRGQEGATEDVGEAGRRLPVARPGVFGPGERDGLGREPFASLGLRTGEVEGCGQEALELGEQARAPAVLETGDRLFGEVDEDDVDAEAEAPDAAAQGGPGQGLRLAVPPGGGGGLEQGAAGRLGIAAAQLRLAEALEQGDALARPAGREPGKRASEKRLRLAVGRLAGRLAAGSYCVV
ncbi:MAG: hypothetical protein ACR2KV_05075, partial [Solirubrobacteraceae bacterium]